LPDSTKVWPGHDYRGRTVSSVGEEKAHNPRLAGKSEDEFVAIMEGLNLQAPKKIAEALPANLTCGMTETMAAETPSERGWAPIERTSDGTPEIDGQWLANHRDDVVVIDVRQPEEYAGELGHITGSQLVPLGQLQATSKELSPEQPFVLVCRSGRRSADAARTLEALGFKRVASLRGGMQHWNTAGLPVSHSAKSA
jgi:rhodanese-related sulfurtransferase